MESFNFPAALTLFLLLISYSFASNDVDEQVEDVDPYLYNEADFQETVGVQPHFIMFFAPWCGHCTSLKPAWGLLSEYYNKENLDIITIAKVDCTDNTKLCSDIDVNGYPTLMIFQSEKEPERYTGARDINSLKEFITKTLGLEEKVEEPKMEDDEGLWELTVDNFDSHVATGVHFIKFFAPWCGHCKKMEPIWKDLAAEYEEAGDIVKIGRVDCTKNQKVCSSNGVKGYPTLIWFKDGQKVENYQGTRQLAEFIQYIEKMTSPEPEKQDDGQKEVVQEEHQNEVEEGLYELTDSGFAAATAKGGFFIKFFAPWCGHCKKMEPAWKELAKFYENDEQVKIGNVDCTKHSVICKSKGVQGYPTLKYFHDGEEIDGTPSGRDIGSLKNFVKKMTGKEEEKEEEEQKEDEDKEDEITEGLYTLTEGNYNTLTANGDFFIKFFAPWCGHCKKMEPAWKELAKFYENDDQVKIANVDCTKHSEVCKSKGVRGYPTLKYFHDGEEIEDTPSGRDIESLKTFVKKMTGKEEEEKEDEEDEEEEKQKEDEEEEEDEITEGLYTLTEGNYKTLTANGDYFIKFFAPWCGHCKNMEPAWKELAKFYENDEQVKIANVDCTKHSEVCKSKGVRGYPTLKYFHDGEEIDGTPSGRDIESLKNFVKKMTGKEEEEKEDEEEEEEEQKEDEEEEDEITEGLYTLTEGNYKTLTANGDFFIKFFAPWCGHCKNMEPAWKELAKLYENDEQVKIANVDCTKHPSVCQSIGVRGYPTLKYFKNGAEIEGSPKARDIENLKEFVKKMSGKQEEVEQVEEPEQEEAELTGALELDDTTFADVIETGITFVKFYAPWCGHCKRLAPIWDDLAKEDFGEVTKPVRIVKVDCTKHNSICSDYGVSGYPTLKLFVSGEEKEKYTGARTLKELTDFIIESTTDAKEKVEMKDEL